MANGSVNGYMLQLTSTVAGDFWTVYKAFHTQVVGISMLLINITYLHFTRTDYSLNPFIIH